MKVRPLIGRRIRISRRLHLNQPLLRILDVAKAKSIYISIAFLQELKELNKYEYFFRVYHNNEIYSLLDLD